MNAPFDITGIEIRTPRLLLRPWKETDLDDFYEYASAPGVGEAAGWAHHKDKEESLKILQNFVEKKKTFAIVDPIKNKAIGSLGVEFYGLEDKLSEFFPYQGRSIGYVLSKDYWGQGLMTEAVKAVIDYLFNVLDYDFLLCGHYDFNARSARVQEKCGFIPYRKLNMETRLGHEEPGVLRLLLNPKKDIHLVYSHPETLLIREGRMREVDGKTYEILKMLGKGKGGYSYLAKGEDGFVTLKQIHHEPCSYYTFGDKIEAEAHDYKRLVEARIRIPKMIAIDKKQEIIVKEYIEGKTIFAMVQDDEDVTPYLEQVREMARLSYEKGLNIDYFPTNFIVQDGLLYYVDYECNEYHEEWSFENWGIRYWSKTKEFRDYLDKQ